MPHPQGTVILCRIKACQTEAHYAVDLLPADGRSGRIVYLCDSHTQMAETTAPLFFYHLSKAGLKWP